jgi:DNA-binding transcriptional regulator YiaG
MGVAVPNVCYIIPGNGTHPVRFHPDYYERLFTAVWKDSLLARNVRIQISPVGDAPEFRHRRYTVIDSLSVEINIIYNQFGREAVDKVFPEGALKDAILGACRKAGATEEQLAELAATADATISNTETVTKTDEPMFQAGPLAAYDNASRISIDELTTMKTSYKDRMLEFGVRTCRDLLDVTENLFIERLHVRKATVDKWREEASKLIEAAEAAVVTSV